MARDINQWLAELGLAKYAARFAANEIDLDVAAQLSDDDLRSLDIPLGPRKKLLKAIAGLVGEPERDVTSASAVAPARHHDGERRQLTVMFCDLVDSTALSTRMDPEDLRDVIRAYHEACAVTVESHGGYVAKYMGDGVMAYFGYPRAHEDDARRAARAGIAIVHAVAMLDIGRHRAIESPLGVRVGIHTGLVVVGDVIGGSDGEPASVTGETPNVASRLQALAGANEVVVGPLTRELMGEAFACDDLGHRVIKGLDTTLQVWRVVRERDLDAVHARRPTHDRLVGRREEVGLLVRAWEASRQGRGQVILIQGESGIGKSRLVDTLRAHAADGDFLWIATRCSPYHASSSLHPVIEHLKRLAGWAADDDPQVRVAKLEAVLRNQSMPLARCVPLYAALLSLPLPEGSYPPLRISAEEQRTQTLDALVAWLLEEADHQPVLRVWEDLQWADSTTLELLGMCIGQAATVPMLNVLTYRPEFTPPWPMRSHMTPISLNRLERQEVEELVTQLAGGKSVSAEVAGYIADKTDGVPLYVEELTKAVLDPRFVLERDGRFELARPLSEVAIPATLHDMLMARLDRFPTIREVAQLGSILGREFAYEMLQAIASLQESELQVGLDQLVQEELLYQRGRRPGARYIFKHALVQDAAYQSLLRRTRQFYHRQTAELIEARYPDIVKAQPELVAHHYARAEEPAKAIHYLALCADNAASLDAHAEAIRALEQARALVEHLPPQERDRRSIQLVIREAQSLHFAGRRKEMVALLVDHAERLARLDDQALSGEFNFWLGFAHSWLGQRVEAEACLQRGLLAAMRAGDTAITGRIHRALATECVYSGKPLQDAIAHARQAASLLERDANPFWLAQALFTLSYCCYFAGAFDDALDAADKLETVAQAAGSARARVNAAMLQGLVLAMRGEDQRAIESCERALGASPDRFETAFILACLGRACAEAGMLERARAVLHEAVDVADQVRSVQFRAWFRTMLGEALLLNGDTALAKAVIETALRMSTEARFGLGIALSRQVAGMIALREGDRMQATRDLADAARVFAEIGARFDLARSRMEQARVAQADGATARACLREACEIFAALRAPRYLAAGKRLAEAVMEDSRSLAATDDACNVPGEPSRDANRE